jgi:hypothetical protein
MDSEYNEHEDKLIIRIDDDDWPMNMEPVFVKIKESGLWLCSLHHVVGFKGHYFEIRFLILLKEGFLMPRYEEIW